MIRSALLALGLAATLLAPAPAMAREEPLEDYPARPILSTGDRAPTLDEVRAAIARAVARAPSGWSITARTQDSVRARFEKGEHWFVVELAFAETTYAVKYIDSAQMNFSEENGTRMIHPNYNRWLRNFLKLVDQELRVLR